MTKWILLMLVACGVLFAWTVSEENERLAQIQQKYPPAYGDPKDPWYIGRSNDSFAK